MVNKADNKEVTVCRSDLWA